MDLHGWNFIYCGSLRGFNEDNIVDNINKIHSIINKQWKIDRKGEKLVKMKAKPHEMKSYKNRA